MGCKNGLLPTFEAIHLAVNNRIYHSLNDETKIYHDYK